MKVDKWKKFVLLFLLLILNAACKNGSLRTMAFFSKEDETSGNSKSPPPTPTPSPTPIVFTSPSTCSNSLLGFFVAPNGLPSNDGTFSRPWDLQTALDHPNAVVPGSNIWLRGGTYNGIFFSKLAGTPVAPIVVRRCGNERPILDAAGIINPENHSNLTIVGPDSWYWGLEITNSNPNRIFLESVTTCFEGQQCRPAGVDVFGERVKIINFIVHDTGVGIGSWSLAVDAEIYGNIVYYSGWQSQNRGSGHGIYTQNRMGIRRITDNIIFNSFHSGVHAYGSSESQLRNIELNGNVIFNNGLLAQDPNGWGIVVGGNVLAENISILNNLLFNPFTFTRGLNINPSWGTFGTNGLRLENNYSVGSGALGYSTLPTNSVITGNSLFSENVTLGDPSTNIIAPRPPSEARVFLKQNFYEPDLMTVTVFNGGSALLISVNTSDFLEVGQRYEVRDVQNLFGPPILEGNFTGGTIEIPMGSAAISQPIGTIPRPPIHTDLTFGVFQLKRLAM